MRTGVWQDNSPAGRLLRYLQRQGPATIRELEQALGVSATAVREQLSHLADLVEVQPVRRRSGRPHYLYTLSEKGRRLFPTNYDALISALLQEVAEQDGREKLDQILDGVSMRLAAKYQERVAVGAVRERLARLHDALEQQGIPAALPDAQTLTMFSCPYLDVAQEHEAVCRMEQRMLTRLLGAEVELEQSIRAGAHHCRFVARPSEEHQ